VRYNGPVSDARSSLTVDESAEAADTTVLAVAGELDLATIGTLKEAVARRLAPDAHVVLDLSGLTFCDSTGLGGLVALHRQARSTRGRLALSAPPKRVARPVAPSRRAPGLSLFRVPGDAGAPPPAPPPPPP